MTVEIDALDLFHMKNYLIFARNYITELRDRETDPHMAEVMREELIMIGSYLKKINDTMKHMD